MARYQSNGKMLYKLNSGKKYNPMPIVSSIQQLSIYLVRTFPGKLFFEVHRHNPPSNCEIPCVSQNFEKIPPVGELDFHRFFLCYSVGGKFWVGK